MSLRKVNVLEICGLRWYWIGFADLVLGYCRARFGWLCQAVLPIPSVSKRNLQASYEALVWVAT